MVFGSPKHVLCLFCSMSLITLRRLKRRTLIGLRLTDLQGHLSQKRSNVKRTTEVPTLPTTTKQKSRKDQKERQKKID